MQLASSVSSVLSVVILIIVARTESVDARDKHAHDDPRGICCE